MPSKNTRFSIFILKIVRPFVLISGFHFCMIALFRIKCRSNALVLCAIGTFLLVQVVGFTTIVRQIPYRVVPKECLFCRIAQIYSFFHVLTPRTKLLHAD